MNKNAVFAENLKRLRAIKNWSQMELSHEAEVGHQTVWRAEQGVIPRGPNIAKIAKALGVTEAQLFADPNLEQSPDMVNVLDIGQLAKQLSSELHKISPKSETEDLDDQEKDLLAYFRRLPSAKLKKVALEFVRDLPDLDPLPNETQMPSSRRRIR